MKKDKVRPKSDDLFEWFNVFFIQYVHDIGLSDLAYLDPAMWITYMCVKCVVFKYYQHNLYPHDQGYV